MLIGSRQLPSGAKYARTVRSLPGTKDCCYFSVNAGNAIRTGFGITKVDFWMDVITQLLPYIGYPRTLNALRCLNEVDPPTP
jgi:alkylhydroperoxidase/carboxymuconolactone decarboxylase family protein YurZ